MLKHFLKSCAVILLSLLFVSNAQAGIDFDKVDDLVDCGTSDTLFTENGAVTISAWIYAEDGGEGTFGRIVSREPGTGTSGPLFSMSDSATHPDTLEFQVDGTTDLTVFSSDSIITYNVWHHVLVTWDGSTTATNVHIYLDNSETTYETQTNGASIVDNSGATFRIGNNGGSARTFNGIISEVAVWNVVLSANQIALLASSRLKGMPLQLLDPDADGTQELVAYWSMDEGTHGNSADLDTAWDMSGNGNNGNPDNGGNNTGLTWAAETILSYPSEIVGAN